MNTLQKLFGFDPKQTTIRTEVLAGITTFLTMSYILAVNPAMFSQLDGMPGGAVFTATALAAIVGTLAMAFIGKLPFGLAPGMGLNAFFVFSVCMGMGYSWQFALTAIFIEGILFIIMTITNIREAIVNAIPRSLRNAIGAGIGLFIAFIGMQNAGIIVNSDATLVVLGEITKGSALLAIIGLIITGVLYVRNVRGAMLIGILATTLIGIPMGITQLDGFFSTPPSIEPIFLKFEWSQVFTAEMATIVFTLLFVDLFDCIGTVIGVTTRANMIDDSGKIPGLKKVFMVDSVSTAVGAAMGTSTVAVYVESAAGVNEGGRTGLTSFTTGCCFLLALFFAPFFLAIPAAATAPVLVLVGLMMMSNIWKVDFFDYKESIPAFICMIFMPLAYSISDGILLGHLAYVIINLLSGNRKSLTPGMYVLAVIFLLKFILH